MIVSCYKKKTFWILVKMINEFKTLKDLQEFYAKHSSFIDSVGQELGSSMEELMRENLLESCKRDYKLMSFNDKYNLSLKKKELKVLRLEQKFEYKLKVKKFKSNHFFTKKEEYLNLKIELNQKKIDLINSQKSLKKSFSIWFKSLFKREKNVKG